MPTRTRTAFGDERGQFRASVFFFYTKNFNIDKFLDVYTHKIKPWAPYEHGTAAIAR
jgi:hypothetical protein